MLVVVRKVVAVSNCSGVAKVVVVGAGSDGSTTIVDVVEPEVSGWISAAANFSFSDR